MKLKALTASLPSLVRRRAPAMGFGKDFEISIYMELMFFQIKSIILKANSALNNGLNVDVDELFFMDAVLSKSDLNVTEIVVFYDLLDALFDAQEHEFEFLYNQPKFNFKYSLAINILNEISKKLLSEEIKDFKDLNDDETFKHLVNVLYYIKKPKSCFFKRLSICFSIFNIRFNNNS